MRDPPLATIEQMEAVRSRKGGEPASARISLGRLADMHEAMNVEQEMLARERAAAEAASRKRS